MIKDKNLSKFAQEKNNQIKIFRFSLLLKKNQQTPTYQ